MSIYEAVGIMWIVFTASLSSVAIMYFAFIGVRKVISDISKAQQQEQHRIA